MILLILWIHALVISGMLMFVQVCNITHYVSVYLSEYKVWTFWIEMQLQCSRPQRILHLPTKTHLGSCAQHPCTARLAECNHSGFQRGEEGHGQAGRSASEPWKGAGMILGEDKGRVEHPEGAIQEPDGFTWAGQHHCRVRKEAGEETREHESRNVVFLWKGRSMRGAV